MILESNLSLGDWLVILLLFGILYQLLDNKLNKLIKKEAGK